MKKQIPNIITLLNLFSGCMAVVMAFDGNFTGVVIWVAAAALFDFFDGLAARALGVSSRMGVELDSLADLVSFGVAPASAVFTLLSQHTPFPAALTPLQPLIPYAAFLLPLFAAYRLAKFNIDERQTTTFLGLPTPANGLFWISYVHGVHASAAGHAAILYVTLAFIILFCLLMVSEIPMFSLKLKKINLKENLRPLLLLLLTVTFVAFWGIIGVAAGMLAYILLSLTGKGKEAESNR